MRNCRYAEIEKGAAISSEIVPSEKLLSRETTREALNLGVRVKNHAAAGGRLDLSPAVSRETKREQSQAL